MNSWWYEGKRVVLDHIGMSTTSAHVVLGLMFFFCVTWAAQPHPRASLIALGSVTLLQLVNEALDAADWIGWTGHVNWVEAFRDTAYTLGLPAVIILVGAGYQARERYREKS